MLKLFQREECPYCAKVRRLLGSRCLAYETINVPKLHSERKEMLALSKKGNAEVPMLVDGDAVLQNSDEVLAYLNEKYPAEASFGEPRYGLTRTLRGRAFADAVAATKEALAAEGFGVLSEIDVQATLKKKLQVEHPPYLILGACNPPLAHEALTAEPPIGLLLPCNVVVTEDAAGNAVVSAVDPIQMFEVVQRSDIHEIAVAVRKKLSKALAAIPS